MKHSDKKKLSNGKNYDLGDAYPKEKNIVTKNHILKDPKKGNLEKQERD